MDEKLMCANHERYSEDWVIQKIKNVTKCLELCLSRDGCQFGFVFSLHYAKDEEWGGSYCDFCLDGQRIPFVYSNAYRRKAIFAYNNGGTCGPIGNVARKWCVNGKCEKVVEADESECLSK